jgi:hypothetical protein
MAEAKELDVSRLEEFRTANPKEDDSRLTLGVFNGAASFALFQGPPGPPKLKIPIRTAGVMRAFVAYLEKLLKSPPGGEKMELSYNEWDPEAKKANRVATLAFFRTDKGTGAIQVSGEKIRGVTFPIRLPLGLEFSALSDAEQSDAAIQGLITSLNSRMPVSQLITSYKRDRQYGGNRGGGGGRGYGNSSGGGQQSQNNSSSADDDIPF